MENKIKEIKDKFYNMRFIIILGTVILGISLIIYFSSSGSFGLLVSSDGDRFKSEYEKYNGIEIADGKKYLDININGSDKIKYSTEDEIVNIFNNAGDAVIYFGYPTCSYCRTAAEGLLNTAKNMELETIYYLDTKNGVSDKLINVMDEKFLIDKNGMKAINEPLVLFVTKGIVVSYNIGTLFSHEDPSIAMDVAQISGLEFIYEHGIKDVLNSIRSKNMNSVDLEEVIN